MRTLPTCGVLTLACLAWPSLARASDNALPGVAFTFGAAVDSMSPDPETETAYWDGTSYGIGFSADLSLLSLFSKPDGFFIRDFWEVEGFAGTVTGSTGYDDSARSKFYARMFLGAGLSVGAGSEDAAFYLRPRLFTGFNTARTGFSPGSGAGRGGWLLGVGAGFGAFGADVAYGKGSDTHSDEHTLFDGELYFRFSERFPLPYFHLHYQGAYGNEATEHDVTLGLGFRY